jgi:hypothetical protein
MPPTEVLSSAWALARVIICPCNLRNGLASGNVHQDVIDSQMVLMFVQPLRQYPYKVGPVLWAQDRE